MGCKVGEGVRDNMWIRLARASGVAIAVLVIAAMLAPRAYAHPHAWIDLQTTAVLDSEGRLSSLEQYWLFGDFYSSYVLADIGSEDREVIIANLREVARQNIQALREHDYFTVIKAGGQSQQIRDVETFETGVIEGRIYLKFTTTLVEPVDVTSVPVRYGVYDPSYYIEVLYAEGSEPELKDSSGRDCIATLDQPSPTFEELAYAASLDKTESGGNGLGQAFAEWVDLTCQ